MILSQGGASYLGILLSLGWSRLFEACVPVKTPWDDVCRNKSCNFIPDKRAVVLSFCDSDLKTGKNLSEPHDIRRLSFIDLLSLTEGIFDGFAIDSLNFYSDSNRVIVGEAGCFENLNVIFLKIEAMNLETLPQEFFRGLTASSLQMLRCTLSNPRTGIFKGVKSITRLQLTYINKLTYLPKDFFQGLHMLHNLYIDMPSGLCLSHTIFQPLTSVVSIYISKGTLGMTYCPKMFKGFTNATTLYNSGDEMSSFVMECNPNMNMKWAKQVKDPLGKNCDRNDGCYECNESAILKLTGSGSAVRGRIVDAAVGVVGALSLVAVLTSAGN